MKKVLIIALVIPMLYTVTLAQTTNPVVKGEVNINGKLDMLDEFSTLITVPVEMPDGIKLMTDIFLPMLQDCMTVTLSVTDLNNLVSGIPLGTLLGGQDINIELIPRGTQLFVYDSIWDSNLNKRVYNTDKYSMPMILTRTPYDKEGDKTGRIITIFGYGYAMQDMRGRYSSEGVYFPMYSDSWNKNPYHGHFKHILDYTDFSDPKNSNRHEDGYNTVEYLSNRLTNRTLINVLTTNDPTNYLIPILNDKNADGIADSFNICNGSLGAFGASALGNTQYQEAAAHKINPLGPGMKALMPIVATLEHYRYTGYQNGVFRERIVTGWLKGQIFDVEDDLIPIDFDKQNSIHTSADYDLPKLIDINNRSRNFQPNQFDASTLAIDHFVRMRYEDKNGVKSLPGYYPNSNGRGDMDGSFSKVNQFGESVAADGFTPLPDLNFSRYTNMDVPAYHLTGWWDIFTDGQIETWRFMVENASIKNRKLQKLIIGPWAHQTIGGTETGDMLYKDNIADIIGFDLGRVDLEDLDVEKVLQSELISWFRYNLNYNDYKNIGLPKVLLPKGKKQTVGTALTVDITIPSRDYEVPYLDFINFINGGGELKGLPVVIEAPLLGISYDTLIDFPSLGAPIIPELSGEEILAAVDSADFSKVPNVRFYVIGPNNDGIPVNDNKGNYWFMSDTFPITNNISWQKMYMHKNAVLDFNKPTEDEGYRIYVHDPDDPIYTLGGANMIVRLPDGYQSTVRENGNSQGQINLMDPRWAHKSITRQGVLGYTSSAITDSLCVIGFPRATIWAKSNPGGAADGDPTDTDFFVRILDVYPDGREFFVVEGCVNARAREYARQIAETHGLEDWDIPFSNISTGTLYELEFRTMPIAYTWGKNHKIKILISSSNWTRYQVNPNLPIEDGDFFRRQPLDGQKYTFNGVEMAARIAVQRIAHSNEFASNIELPIYSKTATTVAEKPVQDSSLDAFVYPNPVVDELNIFMSKNGKYNMVINNAIGQQILQTAFNDNIQLDVKKFDKGMYVIEIKDDKGESKITKKVSVL